MITEQDFEALLLQLRELNKNGGFVQTREFVATLRALVNTQENIVSQQKLCLHNLNQLLNRLSTEENRKRKTDLRTGRIEYPPS